MAFFYYSFGILPYLRMINSHPSRAKETADPERRFPVRAVKTQIRIETEIMMAIIAVIANAFMPVPVVGFAF
jgi:hypothetical protein